MENKDKIEEIAAIIKMCEDRLEELEVSIRSTNNSGKKSLMQETYVLNKSFVRHYKQILQRVSR
jgi:hypothetical protein